MTSEEFVRRDILKCNTLEMIALLLSTSKLLKDNPAWSLWSPRRGKQAQVGWFCSLLAVLMNVPVVFWVTWGPCRW